MGRNKWRTNAKTLPLVVLLKINKTLISLENGNFYFYLQSFITCSIWAKNEFRHYSAILGGVQRFQEQFHLIPYSRDDFIHKNFQNGNMG